MKIFNANVNLFVISEIFALWDLQIDWLEKQRAMEFLFPTVVALLCSGELKLKPNVSDSSQKLSAEEPEMQSGPYGSLPCNPPLPSSDFHQGIQRPMSAQFLIVSSGNFKTTWGCEFLLENKDLRKNSVNKESQWGQMRKEVLQMANHQHNRIRILVLQKSHRITWPNPLTQVWPTCSSEQL